MYMIPTLIQQGTGTETKCILNTITNWQLHARDMTPNTFPSVNNTVNNTWLK